MTLKEKNGRAARRMSNDQPQRLKPLVSRLLRHD